MLPQERAISFAVAAHRNLGSGSQFEWALALIRNSVIYPKTDHKAILATERRSMTCIERFDGYPLAHARGYDGISLGKCDSGVAGSVSDPSAGPVRARSGCILAI